MSSPSRFDGRCTVCNGQARNLLSLDFSERQWLPDRVSLALCDACDFAFTSPADAEEYANYYSATTNDLLFQDGSSAQKQERHQTQTGFLAPLLSEREPRRVLDIGCGNGGLLRSLQARFVQHHYHGVDPNVEVHTTPEGISFSRSWRELEDTYDLIIVSHVLEHIVDLVEFSRIRRLLAAGGALYAEVPDASRYADFPRREYLYYVDRLHINHFTPASLRRLMERWGLSVIWSGLHDFQYKDRKPYPACCVLATDVGRVPAVQGQADLLTFAMQRYLRDESARAEEWRQRLGCNPEVLVYGFGDNFFRARNADGPLVGCRVRAVIDRRWKELSRSRYVDSYTFIDLEQALESLAHLPVVVTVSWQGETIAQELLNAGCKQVFIL